MTQDLWKIRKQKGLSVQQLAARSGVSPETIQAYERGERAISASDRRQLARALYVGEWDIALQSSPPPPREKKPRPPSSPPAPAAPKARPRQEKEKPAAPPKSPPIKDSQVAHLLQLAARFDVDRAALEAEIGKPLEQMTQAEGRQWNGHYMRRMAEEKPKRVIDRRRAYLPEGVDGFEMKYLDEVQEAGDRLLFTLFDRQQFAGTLVGYGPYSITICQEDGVEVSLNKLAIAYYRRAGGGG
ncbi:MAG: helix-turn-helix transcriptional regulator [Anaerolineae bacterium]|nr:helix-turn-helix transcriptional regulator [Anaerolineae bacterium]